MMISCFYKKEVLNFLSFIVVIPIPELERYKMQPEKNGSMSRVIHAFVSIGAS